MTTSGDTTFDCNRDEIVKDALSNLGAIPPNGTPTGAQLTHAARALNRLVKSIDPEGELLWRLVPRTFSTVSGTAAYTLGADVVDVDEPLNYMRSGTTARTPIMAISRDDYMQLADRTTSGLSTLFFFERALPTTVTVTLWPVPDATGDTVSYYAYLRAQDFDTGAQTGDFPTSWLDCLVFGLTARLAPAYKQLDAAGMYEKLFQMEKDKLLRSDGERGNLRMVPFGGSW